MGEGSVEERHIIREIVIVKFTLFDSIGIGVSKLERSEISSSINGMVEAVDWLEEVSCDVEGYIATEGEYIGSMSYRDGKGIESIAACISGSSDIAVEGKI